MMYYILKYLNLIMNAKSNEQIQEIKKIMKRDLTNKDTVSKNKIKKIMENYIHS